MGKGKPRHNPEKPQNNYGGDGQCIWCDEVNGRLECEFLCSFDVINICRGNRHNCCKVTYHQWAGKDPKKEHPSVRHSNR